MKPSKLQRKKKKKKISTIKQKTKTKKKNQTTIIALYVIEKTFMKQRRFILKIALKIVDRKKDEILIVDITTNEKKN